MPAFNFNIIFDQNEGPYTPGQLVTGKVRFFLDSSKPVTSKWIFYYIFHLSKYLTYYLYLPKYLFFFTTVSTYTHISVFNIPFRALVFFPTNISFLWNKIALEEILNTRTFIKLFTNPTLCLEIKIKFEGRADVEWSEEEEETFADEHGNKRKKTVWYRSHEQYFKSKLILYERLR